MIKTTDKEKLPKGCSYPIGAEIISAGLSEVPQYEDLQIIFRMKDESHISLYNRKIKEAGDIIVLDVYSSYGRFRTWRMTVRTVPSAFKKDASEKIISQILPVLRERLLKAGINEEHFSFSASYSLATGDIKFAVES
ncbi:MAG: hypothetical protein Q7U23_11975 [Methylococcales bacterium]|nr:hypothetical protein [Methylococcales bacterium]